MSLTSFAQQPSGRAADALLAAVAHYNNGEITKAAPVLKELTEKDPSNDAAWYYLALCSIVEKDLELAEVRMATAVNLDPSNFWYRYKLAGIFAATSRPELTIEIYERLMADFPKRSELYYDLVEMYSARGKVEKALETLREIETVFGMTESLAVYRFTLLMQAKRQDEAYQTLKEYNSRYSSPYVLSTLAEHELSMYNDSTALSYYDEALEIAPDYSPALLGKAEAFRMTRRYDDYFKVLDDYVSNPSDHARAKTDYLSAVLQRSDPRYLKTFSSQLDNVIEGVQKAHPKDSSVLSLAGIYYFSTGRKAEARSILRQNAQLNPQSVSAVAGYIECLIAEQEWKEMSLESQKAYEKFPDKTIFLEMAIQGEYSLDEYDNVLRLCDRILESAPADSAAVLRALSTKGDIYYQSGNQKKAFKAYEQALKINPSHAPTLNNYAYYLSMQGKNLKKALAMSQKTVEADPDNATYLDTYGWILYLSGRPEDARQHFKRAMMYGGKDSAVILDHYAEVLFRLGEYERAMVYWNQALRKNNGEISGLEEKITLRKKQIKDKTDRK